MAGCEVPGVLLQQNPPGGGECWTKGHGAAPLGCSPHLQVLATIFLNRFVSVFRIRICFLQIWIQGFFLNPDPVPDPDPGKEKTFRKAIQKNLGVPTSMVLIYLYI